MGQQNHSHQSAAGTARLRQPEPQKPNLGACVQCVADHKGAAMAAMGTPHGEVTELPPILEAIMLIGGTGCCFNHLQVQSQSSLFVPNGMAPR